MKLLYRDEVHPGINVYLLELEAFSKSNFRNGYIHMPGEKMSKRSFQKEVGRAFVSRVLGISRTQLSKDCNGKPFVIGSTVQFTTSHSGDMLSVIISARNRVGIDIERLRPSMEDDVADRFVREDEKEASLPHITQSERCYIIWSAKEAMYKLCGFGRLHYKKHMKVNFKDDLMLEGVVKSAEVGEIHCQGQYVLMGDYVVAYMYTV